MKALIIDSAHKVLIDNLKEAGIEVIHKPNYQREDILREIGDYEVVVIRSKIIIDREVIDKAVKLKCIARVGAGMDAIDIAENIYIPSFVFTVLICHREP